MKQTYTISEKLQQLFVIFVPIFVTQAALAGIQVLDAMMSGRFSARDLAGVAIGGNICGRRWSTGSGAFCWR